MKGSATVNARKCKHQEPLQFFHGECFIPWGKGVGCHGLAVRIPRFASSVLLAKLNQHHPKVVVGWNIHNQEVCISGRYTFLGRPILSLKAVAVGLSNDHEPSCSKSQETPDPPENDYIYQHPPTGASW